MDLYGFVFLFLSDHSILSGISGQFYCAMSSEDHNVSAASLKGIPFSGANLIIIQKQKVSLALVLFPLNSLNNICAYQLGYC